ncbi:protein kinase [Myxococcota bacterium]|nr:protein kinase [Myxococcota bacterium]MBU1383115.1 protein kinase [Myxococcota bacterium]MBU1499062.1 protein kinase [Myxococcota bacterium]
MESVDSLIGGFIGSYKILEILGDGSYGTVYKGHHPTIEKDVAIKVLSSELSRNASVVRRFNDEARAVNRIKHPNIIQIFDFGRLKDGRYFYVMEYIEGEELREVIDREGMLELSYITESMHLITRALDAVHRKKIIHRDLKPGNIIVSYVEGRFDLKILDFGIAKLSEGDESGNSQTSRGLVMGTPSYMAPEQAMGSESRIGPWTDVYSLGVILYQMLSGRLPYTGADNIQQIIHSIINDPHPPLGDIVSGLPVGMSDVIEKALDKDPSKRFQSAGEFFNEFLNVLNNPITTFAPETANVTLKQENKDWLETYQENLSLPFKNEVVLTGSMRKRHFLKMTSIALGAVLLTMLVFFFLQKSMRKSTAYILDSYVSFDSPVHNAKPVTVIPDVVDYSLIYLHAGGRYWPVLTEDQSIIAPSVVFPGTYESGIVYYNGKPVSLNLTASNITSVSPALLGRISSISDNSSLICTPEGKKIRESIKFPLLVSGKNLKSFHCLKSSKSGHFHIKVSEPFEPDELMEFLENPWFSGISGKTSMNEEISTRIGKLKRPFFISLESSGISDAYIKNLAANTKIRALYLRGNPVTDMGISALYNHKELRVLSLDKTSVTSSSLVYISEMPSLRELYLIDTKIIGPNFKLISKLKKLRILSLSKTPFDDGNCVHLSKLDNLEMLSIGMTKATASCLGIISRLSSLRILYFYSANLNGVPTDEMKSMKLTFFSGDYSKLSPQLAGLLINLPSMKKISINRAGLNNEFLEVIKNSNPTRDITVSIRKNRIDCRKLSKILKDTKNQWKITADCRLKK